MACHTHACVSICMGALARYSWALNQLIPFGCFPRLIIELTDGVFPSGRKKKQDSGVNGWVPLVCPLKSLTKLFSLFLHLLNSTAYDRFLWITIVTKRKLGLNWQPLMPSRSLGAAWKVIEMPFWRYFKLIEKIQDVEDRVYNLWMLSALSIGVDVCI